MDIKKDMDFAFPVWCREIPFQIKGIAIKDACAAFWAAKGRPKFRSRKDIEQSCFIPKTALSIKGIYPRISKPGLRFLESLPDNPMDSRLIWKFEKWWIAIPHKAKLHRAENQGRVVALDPGVRTFITFFSSDSVGKLGEGDFSRISRLAVHLDNLISRRSKTKKKSLYRAHRRAVGKIKNLITELHFKVAKFLTRNFDIILIPTFETKQMVCKANRVIKSKSVRSLLSFSHYAFKQRLKFMALKTGKTVVECSEAYTSKTHPQTGKIRNIGGSKFITLLDGSRADRDVVGARNILLRALVDSPGLCPQLSVGNYR